MHRAAEESQRKSRTTTPPFLSIEAMGVGGSINGQHTGGRERSLLRRGERELRRVCVERADRARADDEARSSTPPPAVRCCGHHDPVLPLGIRKLT